MTYKQFKTNIKCAACVEKVRSALNSSVGQDQWSVDLQSPARILSIPEEVSTAQVVSALEAVGYQAEPA
jgi:copper chaperone CopZ